MPTPKLSAARNQLKWKQTINTDELTEYVAGDYTIRGIGRWYGQSLRRDWVLLRSGNELSRPSRLSEAKNVAVQDLAARLADN